MGRLSDADYLRQRELLVDLWREEQHVYSAVTSGYQRALHDYFRPSEERWTAEVALVHRQEIRQNRPALPAHAGRAFNTLIEICHSAATVAEGDKMRFQAAVAAHAMAGSTSRTTVTDQRGRSRTLSVRAVLRPEPDLHKLARALIAIALQQAEGHTALENAPARAKGRRPTTDLQSEHPVPRVAKSRKPPRGAGR